MLGGVNPTGRSRLIRGPPRTLGEHYALTLRAWVVNLESNWEEAVAEVGAPRARVWRLYMAASALNFEAGRTQVHQVLAVRTDRGRSGMPLRRTF